MQNTSHKEQEGVVGQMYLRGEPHITIYNTHCKYNVHIRYWNNLLYMLPELSVYHRNGIPEKQSTDKPGLLSSTGGRSHHGALYLE